MRRLVLLAMLAPAAALAQDRPQDRPQTRPTRDVDVTYRATVSGRTIQQRARFVAGAREVRIDTPSPGLYLIINRDAHTMDMVSDGDRGVLQMPYDPSRAVGMAADTQPFRREGLDRVAGIPCTEWSTTDTSGKPVIACFTDDGVMLRARSDAGVLVQAASVTYGPLDPAIFSVPAGYARAVAPERR